MNKIDLDELLAEMKRACVAVHCAIEGPVAEALDSLIRDAIQNRLKPRVVKPAG